MDKIYFHQMAFYGYHGLLPEENKLGQRFFVDLTLELDLKEAGKEDKIEKTVHYEKVYQLVKNIVEGMTYQLVESIAESIATEILHTFSRVEYCTVKVIKPNPPIHGHYDSVAVEITRER